MKIHDIIAEASKFEPQSLAKFGDLEYKGHEDSARKIASYIKENCKPWLSATNDGKLVVYRGFQQQLRNDAFIRAVRKNRVPLDSSKNLHRFFNHIIKMAGKTANRSNSLFVTSVEHHADDYGPSVYVIFPIGDFNYTWHPVLDDWTSMYLDPEGIVNIDVARSPSRYSKKARELFQSLTKHKKLNLTITPDLIHEITNKGALQEIKGDDGTLRKAIESGNEIMIHCDKYVAVEPQAYQKMVKPYL